MTLIYYPRALIAKFLHNKSCNYISRVAIDSESKLRTTKDNVFQHIGFIYIVVACFALHI